MNRLPETLSWLAFVRPFVLCVQLIFALCIGVFALYGRRSPALILIALACFASAVVDCGFMAVGLYSQWKIILFSREVFRVVLLVAELLYIATAFLWPLALFFIIRERRASGPPSI